ncbi:imm11 family protein [Rhodopirellula bahusiensis]|uniref:Immunity MXAN-0049 protein domain-containing protein n=1 Tax=Rhodopirellula bahusiensis TaxID=2014065 RepID=A0A2G1W2A9_9BACT|nr:DUF1629 domain-containing protein [Rhodopirellula bahusiensis]PHQ33166.1 hypothetical protein CEE69_22150 [Rhodopirellula bahusiensis]
MNYFRLDIEVDDCNARFIGVDHEDENGNWHDVWSFSKRETINDVPFRFSVFEEGAKRDFTISSFNIPVVSKAFKAAIAPLVENDVQFVPLTLGNESLYGMNILSALQAIDYGRSLLDIGGEDTAFAGKIRGYVKLAIDETKAGDSHCFRLTEFPVPIIVSEVLMKACLSARLTGMAFEKCNRASTGM